MTAAAKRKAWHVVLMASGETLLLELAHVFWA
jgi:hypothetical protein